MSMKTGEVLAEVARERHRQDQKWGGPTHDDQHDPSDWLEYIHNKKEKAHGAETDAEYRKRMIQIAALAVAAVESLDRQMEAN